MYRTATKIAAGFLLWNLGSVTYAAFAHLAPEGAYAGTGSSFEILFTAMWITYFIGVPILTAVWIKNG